MSAQKDSELQGLSEANSQLCSFAMRWEIDGDYMRCRKCNRPQLTSYMHREFPHAHECKAAGNVESHPWQTFVLLMQPITRAAAAITQGA